MNASDFVNRFGDLEGRVAFGDLVEAIRDFLASGERGEVRIEHPRQLEELADILARVVKGGELTAEDVQELVVRFARFLQDTGTATAAEPEYIEGAVERIKKAVEDLPVSSLDDLSRYNLTRRITQVLAPSVWAVRQQREERAREERQGVLQRFAAVELGESDTILFFVGAGASRPAPSNIPTVNELLPELWEKSDRMETRPLDRLRTWCRESGIQNLEDMLTAVTMSKFMLSNPKVYGLLSSVLYPGSRGSTAIPKRDVAAVSLLGDTLDTVFALLVGTMLEAQPNRVHRAIAECAKDRPNVHVITTNYDPCIDRALDELGVEYDYVLNRLRGGERLSLVKMHGSVNWFYCAACQSVFLPRVERCATAVKEDVPYPLTGMCPLCDGLTKQFIIPPVAHKYLTHPPIVQVWDRGRILLERAKALVIVGYSFAAADDYIAKMVVKALAQNPDKHVVLVDIADRAISRARSLITSHVGDFDEEERFFALQGDAVQCLPQLVESLKTATGNADAVRQV